MFRFTHLTATAAALALSAAAPTVAQADSLVFVKDHDVWLSNTDGSAQYRVTTDGTAANPYQSPSQTDAGIIVTMRAKPNGAPLLMLRQNGEQIGTIPVGAVQAGPTDPHVSPDGQHVAFGIVRAATVNHWLELTTDVRTVRVADGVEVGQTGSRATTPSWLDNRTVLTGTGPVAKYDPIDTTASEWWSDYDHYSTFGQGEDLRDGEAAPGRVVFVRGEGEGKTMQVYRADRGTSGKPSPTCMFSDPAPGPLGARYVDPTLSPDGKQMAWQEGNGIWTVSHPNVNDCNIEPRLLIAGASEPDWSPANVNPGTRPAPAGGGSAPAPAPGTGSGAPAPGTGAPAAPGAGATSWTAKVSSASRSRGVTVKVAGASKGKLKVSLLVGKRVVVKTTGKVSARGTATVKVTIPAAKRRSIKAKTAASLRLTAPDGSTQTLAVRLG